MSARCINAIITGRVQGVGFRWYARREAEERGLAGWVRNLDDGSVEAEAEGPSDVVDGLVVWLRHGPATAEVSAVVVTEIAPTGETGFRQR